jgi:lysyl-tRNA synthetase class 1
MEPATFWADEVAEKALSQNRPIVISTGITPSGQIHIGNMREVLTGDAVFRSLKNLLQERKGSEAAQTLSFHYIADDFDPLRKVYPFLSESDYTGHVGKPISRIPCPCKEHASYADHFLAPFIQSLKTLDIHVTVKRSSELYATGLMNQAILQALANRQRIGQILHDRTGKNIEENWWPVNVICTVCQKMSGTQILGFDATSETIDYACDCGNTGSVTLAGNCKLTWRIDWPARWKVLAVTVEPFGKDHASKGGSYDTGVVIAREVFGIEPPIPVLYEWISLKGQGDMSSSKGNVLSIAETLEVLPPEVLRYMVFRSPPKKAISFDPELGILNVINEYDETAEAANSKAFALSHVRGGEPSPVPFKHMVNLVQIADDDVDKILHILKRSGYETEKRAAIADRAHYARKWLTRFAPLEMRFSIQETCPEAVKELQNGQKTFLESLGNAIDEKAKSGDDFHKLIYDCVGESGITPGLAFQAIYRAILGQDRGPRAGWFLATLEPQFLKKRFREAAQL